MTFLIILLMPNDFMSFLISLFFVAFYMVWMMFVCVFSRLFTSPRTSQRRQWCISRRK